MATGTLNRLLVEVRALTQEEKTRLREELDNLIHRNDEREREALVLAGLRRDGLVTHVPERLQDPADFDSWEPVKVIGAPVSETIIEERR